MPAWLQALRLTTDQTEFLRSVVKRSGNPRIELDALADSLTGKSELETFLGILEGQSPTSAAASTSGDAAAASYARHRERVGEKERQKSAAGRDIGPLPPVVDPERKARCQKSLRLYYETYYPKTFRDPWCEDHLRLIAKLQSAILVGLDQVFAMPRGSGKSAKCERATLWAAKYGHRLYSMLLCANETLGQRGLVKIQAELQQNPLLAADFPEICYPIHCLQRIAQRAVGQTYLGEPTYLQWAGEQIILPVIPDSPSSGAVICVAGLESAVRGASLFHPPTGGIIRPSLVIVDDPQTRATARSEEEIDKRITLITQDIPGMAGPGEPFSMLIPLTVIEPGDVAATLLDREKHPDMRGERCKFMYSMPKNMDLWDEYDAIRRRSFKEASDEIESAEELWQECNDFYAEHFEAMNAGAEVAWEHRKLPHELSAIQHGMNVFLKSPGFFFTEYQNDPQAAIEEDEDILTDVEIARKLSGLERLRVPEGCQYVTGFVDVHKRVLYWTLFAWTPDFDGYLLDYGTFPDQKRGYFTEKTAKPTLMQMFPKMGMEGAIYAGIEATVNQLFKKRLTRDDGAKMPLNLVMIDSGWKPDIIFKYCAGSPFENRVAPSIGRKIGPDEKQLSRCKPKKGEHIGLEWTIPPVSGRQVRQVQFDTYFWKTFFHRRLSTAKGDRGCLSLFGQDKQGRPTEDHDFLSQHWLAEYSTPLTGRFRTVDVWKMKPGASQNHWFDCAVGSACAASVLGAQIVGLAALGKSKDKSGRRVTYLSP